MAKVNFFVAGLIVGLILGFMVGFVYYQPQIDELKTKISGLETKISSLNSQLTNANNKIQELSTIVDRWKPIIGEKHIIQIQAVHYIGDFLTNIVVQNIGEGVVKPEKVYIQDVQVEAKGLDYLYPKQSINIHVLYNIAKLTKVKVKVVCSDGTFSEKVFPIKRGVHKIQILSVMFIGEDNSPSNDIAVYVKNVGEGTIILENIFLNGEKQLNVGWETIHKTIDKNESVTLLIQNVGWKKGHTYTIKITCIDGTFAEGKFTAPFVYILA
ncbi:hypothetical protein CW703_03930 [Candidatus Bathyarchaeota archaeon]|nr:MAG: hypothetical protein CW703_03930 [Candidatus Bathyarchaeota archaeon]